MSAKTVRTIVDSFFHNTRTSSEDVIIKYKKEKGGPYVDLTWRELEGLVVPFASGLIGLGMAPGDRLAILSFNRLEWIVSDLGCMLAGGVVAPIYHTNTPDQCAYVIQDSGARFVVVEDAAQLAKILSKADKLENLERIIIIEGERPGRRRESHLLQRTTEAGSGTPRVGWTPESPG